MELDEWRFASRHDSHHNSADHTVVRYLEWARIDRGLSPQTLRSYADTLGAWEQWAGRGLLRSDRNDMRSFLERPRLRRGHGKMGSPATRRRETSCLRAFYAWCVDEGLLETSPAARLATPKVNNVNPRPLPDQLWLDVWGSDEVTDGERIFLGLGFYLGLRREEMTRLTSANITRSTIRNFVRKGGGEDSLPWADVVGIYADELPHIAGDTQRFVRLMHKLASGDGLVLPWVTETTQASNGINKRMYALQRRLQVPEERWVTPHQLRHSCATNLLRAGVPIHLVSRILNHSSPSITMRYVKAGGAELREWRSRGNG
jgi:integrase/recombinase XerD